MRERLQKLDHHRDWFAADLIGTTADPAIRATLLRSPHNSLALLRNITFLDGDDVLTDHVWVPTWYFDDRDVEPGDRICFVGTVLAYHKGKAWRTAFGWDRDYRWDYGLGQIIWAQPATDAPAQLPVLPIPQTKQEAERLLSWAMPIHQKSPDRYPLDTCNDWGVRLRQWGDDSPVLLEALVQEGWGEPNPSPEDYWLERSPSIRFLSEQCPRVPLREWGAIACLINGIPPSEIY